LGLVANNLVAFFEIDVLSKINSRFFPLRLICDGKTFLLTTLTPGLGFQDIGHTANLFASFSVINIQSQSFIHFPVVALYIVIGLSGLLIAPSIFVIASVLDLLLIDNLFKSCFISFMLFPLNHLENFFH